MRRLLRSGRRRRALLVACLPYLLLSVFVDFVHVHQFGGRVMGRIGTVASAPTPQPTRRPDTGCAICQLQRISTRLESRIHLGPVSGLPTPVAAVETAWPDSPVPHPSAFRGPPASPLV